MAEAEVILPQEQPQLAVVDDGKDSLILPADSFPTSEDILHPLQISDLEKQQLEEAQQILQEKNDQLQRKRAKEEILSTERSYVEDLTTVVEVFQTPVINSKLLSSEESHTLFNNIEVILSFNQQLLLALEQERLSEEEAELENLERPSLLGQIFLDLAPYLKMYTVYVKHYSEASDLLKKLLDQSKPFASLLEESAAKQPERVKNKQLHDFLIMPVQRVPRYRLLLQELLKRTPLDEVLKSASLKINAIAILVNESIRDHEDRMKVLKIQERFGSQVQLIEPHRKFVLEGQMFKVNQRGPVKYQFFLFSDVLVYSSIGQDQQLIYRRTLPLSSMGIEFKPNENGFQISSPIRSFLVICQEVEQRDTWIAAITACQKRWQEHEAENRESTLIDFTGGSVTSPDASASKKTTKLMNHAPVWVPNAEAINCNLCDAKFSLLLRKHHCRLCGHIVCYECSPHRFILPNLGEKDAHQRMCHECYLEWKGRTIEENFVNLQTGPRPAPPDQHHNAAPTGLHKRLSDLGSRVVSDGGSLVRKASMDSIRGIQKRESAEFPDQQTQEEESPLPANWKCLTDSTGRRYYWNFTTDLVTSTRPKELTGGVSNCQLCDSKFSMLLRKHHCKLCVRTICYECSVHKFILPMEEDQQHYHRICDTCYSEWKAKVIHNNFHNIQEGDRPAPPPEKLSQNFINRQTSKESLGGATPILTRQVPADSAESLVRYEEYEAEAPLPPNWKGFTDQFSGKNYYWNFQTDQVTFVRPKEMLGHRSTGHQLHPTSFKFSFGLKKKSTLEVEEKRISSDVDPSPKHKTSSSFFHWSAARLTNTTSTRSTTTMTTTDDLVAVTAPTPKKKISFFAKSKTEESEASAHNLAPKKSIFNMSAFSDRLATMLANGAFGDENKVKYSRERLDTMLSLNEFNQAKGGGGGGGAFFFDGRAPSDRGRIVKKFSVVRFNGDVADHKSKMFFS